MTTAIDDQRTIDHLNSFLRGELAAVETYRLAMGVVQIPAHRAVLQDCATSHRSRIDVLRQEIERRDGMPAQSSGAWGVFAKIVEKAAKGLGQGTAIAALEEGEAHGQNDYERDLPQLDPAARQVIESQVIPEQRKTYNQLAALRKQLDSTSK